LQKNKSDENDSSKADEQRNIVVRKYLSKQRICGRCLSILADRTTKKQKQKKKISDNESSENN